MAEKIIRDPVHDVIAFQMDRDIDALLFRLTNSEQIQRLRRIRQLGMASLTYPGADHSRYSHSLGVMATARKMLDQLKLNSRIDAEQETVCLAAALLHDVGHGPFSHVFEHVSGVSHEIITVRLIEDPDSDLHRILSEHDRELPARVIALMRCEGGQGGRTFLNDILSSQLDADRFDYLLRDNLMTGSQYGGFDLQWLLHALMVDETGDRLVVQAKGISAVEAYLQSRYHMYRNVYFHKVVRAAEGMVKLALQRAKRLAVQDRLEWPPRDHLVYKALLGQRLSIEQYTDLDDISVLHCFKLWMHSADAVLARLCHGLLFRRVFKTIGLPVEGSQEQIAGTLLAAEQAVEKAGGDAGYDLFYDEPAEAPYEAYDPPYPDCAQPRQGILVRAADGTLTEFAAISPLIPAINRQLRFRRLHVAEEYRQVTAKAVG
ncbi:MAG TPA: HD domain-containing protein [Tepidisphaeraceae bacterium]|jgi:HD superfamily phosphohydrolase